MSKKIYRQEEAYDLFHEVYSSVHAKVVGVISGYFHPLIHTGHLSMIREAKSKCDTLIVVVNGENATRLKYGFTLPISERLELISELSSVDYVIDYDSSDMCDILSILLPHYFFRGGDVNEYTMNIKEIETCCKRGIEIIYGIGGSDKKASNTDLIRIIRNGI